MKWSEVLAEPALKNLPYKIELNEWGHIVMSPASNRHGFLQTAIAAKILQLTETGTVLSECSITTTKGVKVADVVWGSELYFTENKLITPFSVAPEICIEILSPGNSIAEMEEKKELYFARGAKEVWICDESGQMTFWGYPGKLAASRIFPTFPQKFAIPYQD